MGDEEISVLKVQFSLALTKDIIKIYGVMEEQIHCHNLGTRCRCTVIMV
jgi:hypothetical protein